MPPTPPIEAEEEPVEESSAPDSPETSEDEATATLDMTILGGQDVAPGDRVELEVVSVDPDMGSVTVKYASKPEPAGEGIAAAAAKYD